MTNEQHATDYLKLAARNQRAVDNLPQDKVKHDDKVERIYKTLDKQQYK